MARAIDAELAMHALATFSAVEMATGDRTRECGKSYDVSTVTIGYEQGIKDALAVLHDMPTIEAEPVKHGHWNLVSRKNIWDDLVDVFECSECKKYTTNGRGNTSPTDFCPNCGARMNKGE